MDWQANENGVTSDEVTSVDQNGQISGLQEGVSTVCASTKSGDEIVGQKRTYVGTGCEFGIKSEQYYATVGRTLSLRITAFPDKQVNPQEWTWSSEDPSIATVNPSGIVKGIAEGDTQITATNKEKNQTCSIWMPVEKPGIYHDITTDFEYALDSDPFM